jgi:molecular chaperone GrpE
MTDDIQPQPEQNINTLQKDIDAITNNWKRTLADFENYKRRKEAENKELVEFAREVTVAKLLPTLDALSQALKHVPQFPKAPSLVKEGEPEAGEFEKRYQNWQAGMSGILMQLDKTLGELGVKKIEAVGKKFDPNFHEAIREQEGEEDSVVVEEIQTGFELNGKVIRPSQVIISKKKE